MPCQLKKPFKGPRRRQGSCWRETIRLIVFPYKGMICPPDKSMIFYTDAEQIELVARPADFWPGLLRPTLFRYSVFRQFFRNRPIFFLAKSWVQFSGNWFTHCSMMTEILSSGCQVRGTWQSMLALQVSRT